MAKNAARWDARQARNAAPDLGGWIGQALPATGNPMLTPQPMPSMGQAPWGANLGGPGAGELSPSPGMGTPTPTLLPGQPVPGTAKPPGFDDWNMDRFGPGGIGGALGSIGQQPDMPAPSPDWGRLLGGLIGGGNVDLGAVGGIADHGMGMPGGWGTPTPGGSSGWGAPTPGTAGGLPSMPGAGGGGGANWGLSPAMPGRGYGNERAQTLGGLARMGGRRR